MSDDEELVQYCRTVANFGRGSAMTDALHKAADLLEFYIERAKLQVEDKTVARYAMLKSIYYGADFDYDGTSALVFIIPDDLPVSFDLDTMLDTLIKEGK